MTVNIKERICVEDALTHPWIENCHKIRETENTDAENEAMRNLKAFNVD